MKLRVRLKGQSLAIKLLRENKSFRLFAEEVGISNAYVSQLCQGKREPGPYIRQKILAALKVEFDEIFEIYEAEE